MSHFVIAAFIILLGIAIWLVLPIFALIFGIGLAIWVLGEIILLSKEQEENENN